MKNLYVQSSNDGLMNPDVSAGLAKTSVSHSSQIGPSAVDVALRAQNILSRPANSTVNILLCGESGSGKTENAKLIAKTILTQHHQIGDRLTQITHFLEAIGNASTIHNVNSSRFVTFLSIFQEAPGSKKKCAVALYTYLLAKGRLTKTLPSETNFPIFYAALRELRSSKDDWYILRDGQDNQRYSKSEIDEILVVLDIPKDAFWQTISIILSLGNLLDKQDFSSTETIHRIATSLGVDTEALTTCLASVDVFSGVRRQYSARERRLTIEGLIREIYESLFRYCSNQVNRVLQRDAGFVDEEKMTQLKRLNILDIYGFETLARDLGMVDQLLINYVNEVIHDNFVSTFKTSILDDLQRQGIYLIGNQAIELDDTVQHTRLLRYRQILLLLNDMINIKFDDNKDLRFTQECNRVLKNKPNLRHDALGFTMNHYAKPVYYVTNGIVDMSCIYTKTELTDILLQSKIAPVLAIRPRTSNAVRSQTKSFLSTVDALMRRMIGQHNMYIRSIRTTCDPSVPFDQEKVHNELINTGIYDIQKILSRVSSDCLSLSTVADLLLSRFERDTLGEIIPDARALIETVLAMLRVTDWTLGFSKLYSKSSDNILSLLETAELPAWDRVEHWYKNRIKSRRLTVCLKTVEFIAKLQSRYNLVRNAACFIQTRLKFKYRLRNYHRAATFIQRKLGNRIIQRRPCQAEVNEPVSSVEATAAVRGPSEEAVDSTTPASSETAQIILESLDRAALEYQNLTAQTQEMFGQVSLISACKPDQVKPLCLALLNLQEKLIRTRESMDSLINEIDRLNDEFAAKKSAPISVNFPTPSTISASPTYLDQEPCRAIPIPAYQPRLIGKQDKSSPKPTLSATGKHKQRHKASKGFLSADTVP